ncbi:MAG: DUF3179 domain-containing protein [candidate division NC10 bacterium]|nr:DUF3179 domain-containing protein [candidate division NC10 bacterium]MBI4392111.1 DUF3179 domain-containing protein [candidate division NC10 bacterium]
MRTAGPFSPIALALLLAAALAPPAWGQFAPPETVEGAPIYTVLPVDAIPAIDDPRFVPAEEAAAFMKENEPVLGVTGGGIAKAFSLWLLNVHEIVNDEIGGTPVAVTW